MFGIGFMWSETGTIPLPPLTGTYTAKTIIPIAGTTGAGGGIDGVDLFHVAGFYLGANIATVYKYSESGDAWTLRNPLANARRYSGTVADTSKVYAVGGVLGTYSTSCEINDIATDVWSAMTAYPIAIGFNAVEELDNFVYSIGGFNGATITASYKYDKTTTGWSAIATSLIGGFGGRAVVVGTKIYVVFNGSTAFYAYDTVGNTWSAPLAVLPTVPNYGLVFEYDGDIYYHNNDRLYVYDILADGWTNITLTAPNKAHHIGGYVGTKAIVASGSNTAPVTAATYHIT